MITLPSTWHTRHEKGHVRVQQTESSSLILNSCKVRIGDLADNSNNAISKSVDILRYAPTIWCIS